MSPTINLIKTAAKKWQLMGSSILIASLMLGGCGGSSGGGGSSQSSESSAQSSSVSSSSSLTSESSSSSSSISSSSVNSSSSSSSSSSSQISSSSSSISSNSSQSSSSSQSSNSSQSSSSAQPLSEKRGLAYGYHSPDDLAAMQGKVAWWYNWDVEPDAEVRNSFANYGFDFVPMAWGGNFNETRLRNFLDDNPGVKYLLGFNEPNFVEQANMTPQQVADLWPTLEAIADDYDLKLVGPAVNFSPGGVDIPGTDADGDPWEYLDAFFAACEGCKVDYIAVHCYMKYAGAFEWFIGEFAKKYNQPIWVTEWASWDEGGPANVNEQMDYLASTVRWMEANPKVYRYSWFIGRTDGGPTAFPYLDVLADDGVLTPLGGLYTAIPATDYSYPVPGKIEAEGAHRISGFKHAPVFGDDGYVSLNSEAGAWAEYKIHVAATDTYQLEFSVNSTATNRQINFDLNGQTLVTRDNIISSIMPPNIWRTYSVDVELPAGEHTLRMETSTPLLRVNWIEISN